MRALFLAPMKHPDHPSPSGERTMARLFARLLEKLGYDVPLVSDLRTLVAEPSPQVWQDLDLRAQSEVARIVAEEENRDIGCVFTYHNYHRAPDLIGPDIATRFGVPYVVAEPSIAPRHASGPYATGYERAMAALGRADLLLCLTGNDRDVLERFVPNGKIVDLKPFLDTVEPSAHIHRKANGGPVRLLTVAMMRARAKLASYDLLARSLRTVEGKDWTLDIVGDGPARAEVEHLFAPFGSRIRFHGSIENRRDLDRLYAGGDLLVWPAVDEAFGTIFLEAAAQGVPAVAGHYGGVPDVVIHERTGLLVEAGDANLFGQAIGRLIDDIGLREDLGAEARRFVHGERTLDIAVQIVANAFERLGIPVPQRRPA